MIAADPFHYPPDLLNLLVDTIPRLVRSRRDVLNLFEGAGVSERVLRPANEALLQDSSVGKYQLARQVLLELNRIGDPGIRPRRELLRRVTNWEDFSTSWDNDRLPAQGLVAAVREMVNAKDTLTRIEDERRREAGLRRAELDRAIQEKQTRKAERVQIRDELASLFGKPAGKDRGDALEALMTRLFKSAGISIREPFRLRGEEGEGVVEQVDGVVAIEGELYFVEVKWTSAPTNIDEVSRHLVRIYHRDQSRGILISAAGYTKPAVATCDDALAKTVVTLCTVRELLAVLDDEGELANFLLKKVQLAIVEKRSFVELI